ncbi:HAMP domain-containing histidine kinase [Pendulispora rubella]|uniref:histidine kinase n=1 Tax=Pendulispora rubella TaxID=2741070 RepID=A0ABZ2L6C1_9BACT
MLDSSYFDRDIVALRRKGLVPTDVGDLLELHWSGELFAAWEQGGKLLAGYAERGADAPPLLIAEHALMTVKLGRSLPEVAPSLLAKDRLAMLVYEYARFHSMYFVSHRAAMLSLWRLFLLGVWSPSSGIYGLVFYNVGHTLALWGWPFFGYPIAKFFFHRAASRVQRRGKTRFGENVVVATFLYTVLVSARLKHIETVTHHAQSLLPSDPYYQTLFLVSSLYAAAYSGNHARAEVVSTLFLELHERGQLLRYRPIAEIMPLVPLALRGYGHLVEKELATVIARHETLRPDVGHVVDSAFFRAAALVTLSTGKFADAKSYILRAIRHRELTRSFQTWQKIDRKILQMAERHETFVPDTQFFGVSLRTHVPVTLGKLLLDLVSAMPAALSGGLRAFEDRAFDLLRRHLDCLSGEIRPSPARFSENLPQIRIGTRYLVLTGIGEERIPAVDKLFASVAPALAILEHNIRDMLALKAENDRNARAVAITRTTQMLAHDVRRPFQLLRIGLQSLGKIGTYDEAKDVVRTLLPEVERATRDVDNLIADTMNIGDYPTPSPTPLEELITESLRDVFAPRPDCNIELRYDGVEGDLHLAVDPIRMRRALSNVISNAVEAMHGIGFIWVVLAPAREEGFCELRIGNSGPAIAEDQMGRIFEAFHSAGKPGGTGLGLAIAQRVILAHGGEIDCANVAEGVEFRVTLPIAPQRTRIVRPGLPTHSRELAVSSAPEPPASVPQPPPSRRSELALVDDSRAIYLAWRAAIGEDAIVRYYRSPVAFWAALEQEPELLDRLQAVVTDYRFSNREECGSKLALQVRRRRPDLPIFVSSSGILEDVDVDGIFDRVIEKGGLPSWSLLQGMIASVRTSTATTKDAGDFRANTQ